MENSFEHIHVQKSRDTKHLGGADGDGVTFAVNFFREKYVIFFDDIITRDKSMVMVKDKLESMGAHVIGEVTLGKTVHHDCGEAPF